jgi:AraC-like DNA-binding protein
MFLCRYIPQHPLSAFVVCLWYAEGAPNTHAKELVLPNGEAAAIFNLRDDPLRIYDAQNIARYNSYGHAVLSGARSNCFVIDTCQQDRVAGIQFRPGGAFPFFRMPACELGGASFDLDDLWATRTGEIREQLLTAQSVDAMFAILERCLTAQLVRPLELHPAVAYAVERFCCSAHGSRVGAVTERIGLSPRRFIQLFHQQVGLTPKAFCRVRRFQRVLQFIHERQGLIGHSWRLIAATTTRRTLFTISRHSPASRRAPIWPMLHRT